MKKPIERTLGRRIDELFAARARAKKAHAEAVALTAYARSIETKLLGELAQAKLDGARGLRASASVVQQTVGSITDYDAFTTYIAEHKAYDLFQKRVHVSALEARRDAGEDVPGVKTEQINNVRLTTRKKA